MKWTSHVSFVRTFPSGHPLSYGGRYVTDKETSVAYVPIGYADGYPRALSNRGCDADRRQEVQRPRDRLHGLGARGRDGPSRCGTRRGGRRAGRRDWRDVTADELAEQAGTIPYEVLCNVSKRIPRRYVR